VQQKILEEISNTLRGRNVPLIFLIASRPEAHLSVTFNLPAQTPISIRLALDDHYEPEEDIHIYLEDSFEQIKSTHPRKDFIPKLWPSADQIDELVYKASGQFIYAATVVKYIASVQHSPIDRLEVILGLHPPHNDRDRPFAELDAVYTEIFHGLDEPRPALQILIFRNTNWFMLASCPFYSYLEVIACVLSLKPGDVCGWMSNISALVTLKPDSSHGDKFTSIEIHHKSLMDFLEDPSRAGTFYCDPGVSHALAIHGFLRYIQDERKFKEGQHPHSSAPQ
jgi:hypothetical protein